jgi:plastocyanin
MSNPIIPWRLPSMRTPLPVVLAVLLLLPGALAAQYDPPGGDPPDGGGANCTGAHQVHVKDNFFDPASITIQAGETVTWCWDGPSMLHNVVENGGAFRCANGCDHSGGSGAPATSWSFSLQFDQAGTVHYHCEVHGIALMSGQVIVQGGGGGGGGGGTPGNLRLAQSSYTVAETGGQVAIGVVRSGGDDGAVGVQLTTANGSATSGQDFGSTSTTVSFNNNQDGTKTVMVPILNDAAVEGNETFTVRLMGPTGGATLGAPNQATVTITDDDEAPQGPGSLSFGSFAFAGVEGSGDAVLEVVRAGGTSGAVGVHYETSAGSAVAGDDFQTKSGNVQIPAGASRATISIPLSNDGAPEGVESFRVTLSSPTGGASLGAFRTANVLVFDDEESPSALTADEVLCDGFRLAALLDRLAISAPNGAKPPGVNLSFTRLGDFAGVAYTGNGPGTPEHQLAFSTNPEETTFLRNPGRPQLFALSMSRNQTNSDLVPEGDTDELRVFLNPTQTDAPDPLSLLEINDVGDPVSREGGTPSESKPGRGIEDAVRLCHAPLTGRDQHVFRVLSKIARLSADGAAAAGIAIYRGEQASLFRIDAYPLDASGATMGRLALELAVDFGPEDRLDGGTLRVLDRCGPAQSAGCTSVTGFTELQLVPPELPGEFWNDSPWAVSTSGVQGDGQPMSNVDFAALLQGTSWRRPL